MKHVWIYVAFFLGLVSCTHTNVPREYGYFRIDLPEHQYALYSPQGYPYQFMLSQQATVSPVKREGECYWIDICYPQWKAVVHCSYKPVQGNLRALSDDAQEFVFSHVCKATSIPEHEYADPEHQVYGLSFDLVGNTASALQFYLTDSTHHFFRGSLYFNVIPNQDSLSPVTSFIREDVCTLMESFRWTKNH